MTEASEPLLQSWSEPSAGCWDDPTSRRPHQTRIRPKNEELLDRLEEAKDVYEEESLYFANLFPKRFGRSSDSEKEKSQRFSVAFSGGGIRAAAFQAGVLWRLAEENRLKDVEYLAAVSGGGYIAAAFASFCAQAPPPEVAETDSKEDNERRVKEWYLDRVADCICRMQHNAGNFIRDWSTKNAEFEKGAGSCARYMDTPILIGCLLGTLALHPLMFFIAFLVPFTVVLDAFFGAGMRAAFCAKNPVAGSAAAILSYTPFSWLLNALVWTLAGLLLLNFLRKLLPCFGYCKVPKRRRDLRRERASRAYLIGYGLDAFFVRFSFFIGFILILVGATVFVQENSYGPEHRRQLCFNYLVDHDEKFRSDVEKTNCTLTLGKALEPKCGDRSFTSVEPWWNFSTAHPDNSTVAHKLTYDHLPDPFNCSNVNQSTGHVKVDNFAHRTTLVTMLDFIAYAIAALTVFSCFLFPCIGFGTLVVFFSWLLPICGLCCSVAFMQLGVFAAVTVNASWTWMYTDERFQHLVQTSLLATLCIMPFYEELRAGLHHYYRRCLRQNFFDEGKDVPITELAQEHMLLTKQSQTTSVRTLKRGGSYCPLLLLTVTSSDYQPPGDNDTISEICFSPLHMGCEETGFINTPRSKSLSKCAALSGAGCLDAIALTMSNWHSVRFWLEALNLTWGDYVTFTHRSRISDFGERLIKKCGCPWAWEDSILRVVRRVPGGAMWFIVYACVWSGLGLAATNKPEDCEAAGKMYWNAAYLCVFLFFSGFFQHERFFQYFAVNSWTRLALQLTSFVHKGNQPPVSLYCTDGGVVDCTAVEQLLRRKRKRILLVYAAGDPLDELVALKRMMAHCVQEQVASFFDVDNQIKSVDVLLDKWAAEHESDNGLEGKPLLIGIAYSFEREANRQFKEGLKEDDWGYLHIVKNRLPRNRKDEKVGLFSKADITRRGDAAAAKVEVPAGFEDLTVGELGSCSPFNSGHLKTIGTCGAKFPHGGFCGYLYLTPFWFSGLARLGYHLSGDSVKNIATRKEGPQGESL